jgi:hypothetical protein
LFCLENKSDNGVQPLQSELLAEFDEGLWRTMVNTVTVKSSHKIIFALKDGTELSWTL